MICFIIFSPKYRKLKLVNLSYFGYFVGGKSHIFGGGVYKNMYSVSQKENHKDKIKKEVKITLNLNASRCQR